MEFSPNDTTTSEVLRGESASSHHKKNLYPVVRHIFLIVCILASLAIIVFLLYQNGKSIYDNGI